MPVLPGYLRKAFGFWAACFVWVTWIPGNIYGILWDDPFFLSFLESVTEYIREYIDSPPLASLSHERRPHWTFSFDFTICACCVCTHVPLCMYRSQETSSVSLHLPPCLDKVLFLFVHLPLCVSGIVWVLEIWAQAFILVQQALYTRSYLLASTLTLYKTDLFCLWVFCYVWCPQSQKAALNPLELRWLWANHMVLGTEPKSSGRVASALNSWDISVVSIFDFWMKPTN